MEMRDCVLNGLGDDVNDRIYAFKESFLAFKGITRTIAFGFF